MASAYDHDLHRWMTNGLDRLRTTLNRDISTLLPQSWAPAG